MKKYILLSVLIIKTLIVVSQQSPKQVLGTFIHKGLIYNYDFKKEDENNYSLFISQLDVSQKAKKTSQIVDSTETVNESGDSTLVAPMDSVIMVVDSTSLDSLEKPEKSPYFSEFSKEIFDKIFKEQMITNFDVTKDTSLQEKSSEIFFKIKARLEFIDDEPTTAYFILKKDNIASFLKDNQAQYYKSLLSKSIVRHDVYETSIETDDGTIKNIKVKLIDYKSLKNEKTSPRKFLDFKNQYPVSISGKFDPDRLASIFLYCTNCGGIKGLTRFIKLSDLLVYDILLENEKEDYSPANKVVNLSPGHPIAEVRKEQRSKILEVAAYTDFVGLNQDQPNGLIQFEVKRRITINSAHRNWKQKRYKTGDSLITMEEYSQRFDITKLKGSSIDFQSDSLQGKTKVYKTFSPYYDQYKDKNGKVDSTYTHSKIGKPKRDALNKFEPRNSDTLDSAAHKNGGLKRDSLKNLALSDSIKAISMLNGNRKKKLESNLLVLSNSKFYPINYVWFNNIEFKLQFLKLDQNNRYLPADAQIVSQNIKNIQPIDLYRYQLTTFGGTLELFRLNFVQQKFSWNVMNLGINWFTVRVEDSDTASLPTDPVKTISLNNVLVQPGTSITWRPDSRYGITLGATYIHQSIWNNKYDLENKSGILQYHVNAHLRTSENSRLFFRFKLSREIQHRYQNFTQIQLGYNVDIFNMKAKSSDAK